MKTTHRAGRRARRGDQPRSDEEVRGGWTPLSALPDRVRETTWRLTPRHVAVLAVLLIAGLAWAGWSLTRARPETLPPATTTPGTPVAQPNHPNAAQPAQPGTGHDGATTPGTDPAGTTMPSTGPGATAIPGTGPGATLPGTGQGSTMPGTGVTLPGTGVTAGPGAYPSGHLSSPAGPGNLLVIHVAGKVRRPGVIRAPAGSRVADAITAAGGALPGVDLSSVNLARPLTDGEQILVGLPATTPNLPPPSPTGPASSPSNPSRQVNLNTATLADLESLPGVGPVLAQRILDYRTEHGRFATIDELQDVTGVGAKKFDSLKSHVHV